MIVSCGEALIDFLPSSGDDGHPAFRAFPGGSPFNVAIALARLGVATGFYGGLSTDLFGGLLHRALTDNGVDIGLANVNGRPTTLAFLSLQDGNARYAFFDEGSAGRMLDEIDLPALPRAVTALHFGSFSLAEEPCGSAYEALMRREQRDRVMSLDPNIRPSLVKNRDGYIARLDRMAAMTDIVKLSEEDLAWMAPDAPFEDVAGRWLAAGARLVVLTRGADGATARSRSASVAIPGVATAVADTVGAGDTFTAGLIARLHRQGLLAKPAVAALQETEIADALSFAARAAAMTVSRAGADPPRLADLG